MKEYIWYNDNYWIGDSEWECWNCDDIIGSSDSKESAYIACLVKEGIPLYEGRDCLYDLPIEMLEQIAEDISIKITFVS